MQTFHELFHLPHHKSEYLSLLYIVATARSFVMSFLSLFIPILLFNKFISLGFKTNNALIFVGVAFLFFYLAHGISVYYVSRINATYGIKKSFFISQILFVVFLFIINYAKSIDFILLSFELWGIASAFWWLTYHIYFLEVGKKREFGRELGIAEIFGIGAGLISPFIAGIILNYLGSFYLYGLALIAVFISLILVIFTKDFEKLVRVNIEELVSEFLRRKREFSAYVGVGTEQVIYSVVWPLLLFSIFKNYLAVGGFSSLVILVTAFAAFISGRLSDKMPKDRLEKFGSGVVASMWLGKVLFQSPTGIFVLDAIYRVFVNFFYLPITALGYDNALTDNKVAYLTFREIAYKIGNMLGLAVFIFFIIVGLPFWLVFIAGALFSLLPMLIRKA